MLARIGARPLGSLTRGLGWSQRGIATSGIRFGGGGDAVGAGRRNEMPPRGHLRADGQRKMSLIDFNVPHGGSQIGNGGSSYMQYHQLDHLDNSPPFYVFEENGKTYIKGAPRPSVEELFWEPDYQGAYPFWSRLKMINKGNYRLNMKAEFLFFYIPTLIIFGLVMPIMMTIYAQEEAIYTTMTVKIIGRQWYWLYEVESPVDDDEEDE